MTTTPVLFLDVDGVINAIAPAATADEWPDYTSTTGSAGGTSWPILYSPTVIDALGELHELGLVEIRWLTTWGHDAPALGEHLGLPVFEVAASPREERFGWGFRGWWKHTVVQEFRDANPGHPFIWLDDDLPHDSAAVRWLQHLDMGSFLAIGPLSETGLRASDIELIRDFLI